MNKIEIKAQLEILEWLYQKSPDHRGMYIISKQQELEKRLEQLREGSDIPKRG